MRPHLLLTYDFPPIGGGIARMMGELARCYPDRSLIVSTGSVPGSESSDAALPGMVDRLALPARRLRTLPGLVRWSLRADRVVREHNVGFSWCGNIRPAAYPARWLLHRRTTPYGVILYGGDLLTLLTQYQRSARKRWVGRALLANAAVIVAISEYTRDLAVRVLEALDLSAHAHKIVVVPLGTDPAVFHSGVDPAPARRQFGLPEARWLLTVARLTPHKGIDTAIRVLAQLLPLYPDLRYAVAGRGDDRDRLGALATRLGVADRVHWLGGVADELLPSLYRNAELYLGLSRREGNEVEGFGISMVEASGCGVPVIGGRSGGVPDAVREGETGLLVDPTSVDAAASAVSGLLGDRGAARRLGAGGRRAVEQFYNWDRVAKDFRRLGDEVTAAVEAPER